MRFRLRIYVERHEDGRHTASVLGLPRAATLDLGGPGLDDLVARVEPASPRLPLPSPLSAYGEDVAALGRALGRRLAEWIASLTPAKAAEIRFDPDQRVEHVDVTFRPEDWSGAPLPPATVPFAVIVTRLPRAPHVAFVPKLALTLALDDIDGAAAEAAAEIGAFLKRRKDLRSIEALFRLEPALEERLETIEVEAEPIPPLEVEERRRGDEAREETRRAKADADVLAAAATDLLAEAREGRLARAYEHEDAVLDVLRFLRSDDEPALLLVGPGGAGKTAALDEAILRRRLDPGCRPIWGVTGARLVAGMTGFGAWQERCRAVVATLRRTRAVLCLGDPHELIESGPSVGSSANIAQYFKRPIEQGHVRAIAECTDEAYDALERRDRGFASLFRVLRVREPERPRTLAILAAAAAAISGDERAKIAPAALATCADLHARFAPYGAFPGKALRFLRRIAADLPRDPRAVFDRAELTRAFARRTGLPEDILSDERPLDPDALRAFLRARVVAQDAATDLLASVIARVKAGVADPRRPLGSLLFLGPTGVGKTEAAKALAEYLFGSRERTIRLDMTEYADPWAAARLTGGGAGDGAGDLVRRVRAEPLSVVLLDEIEKAHAGVFDLLLQVLGDGRLTDARGRTTDFRSTIVILTSNLGAELPEGAIGFGDGSDPAARFIRAAEDFFRPELVNRIDAVVPFAPLAPAAIARIAEREIDRALAREGLARRGTAVEVTRALREKVLAAGTDARYGARPLKRAIERHLVAPLSLFLAEREDVPRRLEAGLDERHAPVVRLLEGPRTARPRGPEDTDRATAAALLSRVSALRREAYDLVRGDVALEVRDSVETLRVLRAERTDAAAGARLRRLEAVLERLAAVRRAAEDLEDLATAIYFEHDDRTAAALDGDVERLAADLERVSFRLRATTCDPPDAALVLLAPVERERSLVPDLLRIYKTYARAERLRLSAYAELHTDPRRPGDPRPAWWAFDPDGDWPPPLPGPASGALLLRVEGEDAVAHLLAEDGRHRHTPEDVQAPDRWALVRVEPFDGTDRAFDEARAKLHTVRFPGEKAPRGVPLAMPPVSRNYSERPPTPGIRDPRGDRLARGAGLESAATTIFRFALAHLERCAREGGA